jgi:Ca-activated chloride channel family protein
LSIRYGIITPYTSYLIEEDDIFSQTARQGIAENAVEVTRVVTEMETMVEEAAASADMAAAEAPMALPTMAATPMPGLAGSGETAAVAVAVEEMVQLVGSKTFVMRDGVWMDTAFDADTQTAQEVGFASEAYFDLLTAVPQLGQYLALGEQVLVVYENQVYQIVPGAGASTITLPEPVPELMSEPENGTMTGGATAVPAASNTANQPTNQPTNDTPSFSWGMIVGILGAILVVIVLFAGKLVGKRP